MSCNECARFRGGTLPAESARWLPMNASPVLALSARCIARFAALLRMAPILEPVLSVVAAALVMLAFGWLAGKKGLLGRVHWAIVWPLYFISGSAVTALSFHWLRSPHPGGESELGGYLLTAGFILQALCLLFAAGLFLVGLQIGTPRVSRQRAEGSHRMP